MNLFIEYYYKIISYDNIWITKKVKNESKFEIEISFKNN